MEVIQLAPAPRPIGISQNFITQRTETLIFDGSDDVKTPDGQRAFGVDSEAWTLSARMHLYDRDGKYLFDLRKDNFTLHRSFYALNEAGERLFEVQKKFQLTSKVVCTFKSITGLEEELTIDGDLFDSGAQILTKEGQTIAIIDRKSSNAKEYVGHVFWGGDQFYHIAVAANIDISVITALLLCLGVWKVNGFSTVDWLTWLD